MTLDMIKIMNMTEHHLHSYEMYWWKQK